MTNGEQGTIRPIAAWVTVLAAVFGGITLVGLFVFAFMAGTNPTFVCNGFTLLAAVFALGSALAAGFIGGAATLTGNLTPGTRNGALVLSAGGGVAVLFIAFYAFQYFKPDTCNEKAAQDARTVAADQITISTLQQELATKTQQLDNLQKLPLKVIIPDGSTHSIPVASLVVQYVDQSGDYHPATRDGNSYTIPISDMLPSGDISVTYSLAALPAQRTPTSIPIEKLNYLIDVSKNATSATQIRLWLADPH